MMFDLGHSVISAVRMNIGSGQVSSPPRDFPVCMPRAAPPASNLRFAGSPLLPCADPRLFCTATPPTRVR